MQIAPIQVPASQWKTYLAERAKANAAKRKADSFLVAWGIDDGATYANHYGLTDSTQAIEIPIQDMAGAPIGKLTVSHREGYEVPSGWTKRIS